MRWLIAFACSISLAADLAQVRQLEEQHRMFELRNILDQPGGNPAETALYRAITTSRFGREREAFGQPRAFLATKSTPEMERKARYELASALTRLSQYGKAASSPGPCVSPPPARRGARTANMFVRYLSLSAVSIRRPLNSASPRRSRPGATS